MQISAHSSETTLLFDWLDLGGFVSGSFDFCELTGFGSVLAFEVDPNGTGLFGSGFVEEI